MVLKDLASSESRAAEHVENINVTAELLNLTPYTNIFTYQLMFNNEFALLGSRPTMINLSPITLWVVDFFYNKIS